MPNHCYNQLWIYGPQEEVLKFKTTAGLDKQPAELNFAAFVPYPERWAQMDAEMRPIYEMRGDEYKAAMAAYEAKWGTRQDGYNSGGYDWCCDHWGTKWNAYEVAVVEWSRMTVVLFQTAWSPPLSVFDAMAAAFPSLDLELQFSEAGCRLHGYRCRVAEEGASREYGEEWTAYDGMLGG